MKRKRDFEDCVNREDEMLVKEYIRRRTSRHALHQHILKGNVEGAIDCLGAFTSEELQADKIGETWTLHCLPPETFKLDQTEGLILKYLEAGWDVNAESCVILENPFVSGVDFEIWVPCNVDSKALTVSNFTLLHLACFYESYTMLMLLLDHGADVNKSTGEGGSVRLSPFYISILCQELESAYTLLCCGCNVDSQINFDMDRLELTEVTEVSGRTGGGRTRRLTTIQLVLKIMGINFSGSLMSELMFEAGLAVTVEDLHVALEGEEPCNVAEVLNPFFRYDHEKVTNLLATLVDMDTGCNCNLGQDDGSLLFRILEVSEEDGNHILLRKLLQFDHVTLHVEIREGKTPVEFVLTEWFSDCCVAAYWFPWRDIYLLNHAETAVKDAVILLIQHGADVSNLVIRPNLFQYRRGYTEMIKAMYAAGAKFEKEYFQTNIDRRHCQARCQSHAREEFKELQKWIGEREVEDKLNLQFQARIALRKRLKTIGHLSLLNCLPPKLKDQVLCKSV